jgi:hypothetical protein
MYYDVPKRTRRRYRVNALKEVRYPQEPLWQEIADLVAPFRYFPNAADFNKARRATKIYNSTGSRALKVLQSGLVTAAADPTAQWISFSTKDPERAEYGPHRRWLDSACTYVLETIGDSNAYQNLPVGFGNSAAFGLFAMGMEEDFEGRSALKTRLYPHGRFWIAKDDDGIVRTFYEECRSTIWQLFQRFGESANFSQQVRDYARKGEWEVWVDVAHMIEPNDEYEPGSPLGRQKKYSDCWWEIGNASTGKQYLDKDYADYIVESGFDEFPVMVGQWSSTEGDVYPTEYPGSECLGDNKSLQIGEKRMWQAIEKLVNPHWIAPAGLKGDLDDGFVPGRTSYVDEKNEGKSIRPAHVVDHGFIAPMREEILAVQQRILEAFHYPTFSTFDSLPDKQRTATEILERKSEKLLKLVDMYTNLQVGVLRPLVDFTFKLLIKRGDMFRVCGVPPPDLQGHEIEYRFQGVLAQAQKMNRVQPIQFAMGIATQIAQAQQVTGQPPEIFDKFDPDQAIDEIATDIGVPATVIRSDAEVAAIRQQRAQMLQQQQQMAAIQQASQAAKNLGQAKLDDDNALGALVKAG